MSRTWRPLLSEKAAPLLHEFAEAMATGLRLPHKITVEEYLERWLRESAEHKVAGRTFRGYSERRIRLHDLRHMHASQLLKQGVQPKIVSERLGHATIGITLETYSHLLPGLQEEAATKVDLALGAAISRSRE